VNFTGTTSMEIGCRLESEDPHTAARCHVATCYLTFVAIDAQGKPRAIPPVIPETEEEKRRFRDAEVRRASRLELKNQLLRKRALTP
jgi:acyl-CoA hydrolase